MHLFNGVTIVAIISWPISLLFGQGFLQDFTFWGGGELKDFGGGSSLGVGGPG